MNDSVGAFAGIGNTPLVELRRVVPANGARIFVKLEWANPTGSMKDRMARAAVEGAVRDGRLVQGGTVVEYTAGTTGISLAFACAVLGFGLHVVFSDAFSDEKRRTMLAFGATVEDVPSDNGAITETLIKQMIARAAEVSKQPGMWWCDQLNNHDAVTGYLPLGEEIWTQTKGPDRRVRAHGRNRSLHSRGHARAPRAQSGHQRLCSRTGRIRCPVRSTDRCQPDRRHWYRLYSPAVGTGCRRWHPHRIRPTRQWIWRGAWPGKRGSLLALPQGRMLSPLFTPLNVWGLDQQSSPSSATPDSVTSPPSSTDPKKSSLQTSGRLQFQRPGSLAEGSVACSAGAGLYSVRPAPYRFGR